MAKTKWDEKWDDLAKEERRVLDKIERKEKARWQSQEVLEEFDQYGNRLHQVNSLALDQMVGSRYGEMLVQTLDENISRNYSNQNEMDELISDLRKEAYALEDKLDDISHRRQRLLHEEEKEKRKNGN